MNSNPMKRPPEPESVRLWREWTANGPPRCCHTCHHYDNEGFCERFEQRPPEGFAATHDACPSWVMEIPF